MADSGILTPPPPPDETDPQVTPHALECEQALLGAILVNNAGYHQVADRIEEKHFYEALHARIWAAISGALTAGGAVTPITLIPVFRDDATMTEIGGPAYLFRLAASATTIINAPEYARVIVDTWRRRETMYVVERLKAGMYSPRRDGDANDMLRESLADLAEFDDRKPGLPGPIERGADKVLTRLDDAIERGVVADTYAYAGSAALAQMIGGWCRTELYILGGRPSMGKTSAAISWLLRTAGKGYSVFFASLEMSADRIVERALTDLAWSPSIRVPYNTLQRNQLDRFGLERLRTARERLDGLPFHIDDRRGLTLAQIRIAAQREANRLAAAGKRLDVVAIDHLGLIRATDRYAGNKVAETAELSASLKVMAKELDCAVVALVQLNRQTEGRENKRPTLADLRWAGEIEQDADAVLFTYREAYYLERTKASDMESELERQDKLRACEGKIEIIVAKQRNGPIGVLDLGCDMPCNVIRDQI